MFKVPEKARVTIGPFASTSADGNNGLFVFDDFVKYINYTCVASDGKGWEHVSVTLRVGRTFEPLKRSPTWDEMVFVKEQFWTKDDAVIQVHPALKDYVNFHLHCLHLWRPMDGNLILPPKELVGAPKG